MSVYCRVFTGLTLEFAKDLDHAAFKKFHEFVERHPELDEYSYESAEQEGKLLLIADGMSGEFVRLVQAEHIYAGSMGESNEFRELAAPYGCFSSEIFNKMKELYKEYTGEYPALSDFKYAMWSQWY